MKIVHLSKQNAKCFNHTHYFTLAWEVTCKYGILFRINTSILVPVCVWWGESVFVFVCKHTLFCYWSLLLLLLLGPSLDIIPSISNCSEILGTQSRNGP